MIRIFLTLLTFSLFIPVEKTFSQCNTNNSICTPGTAGPFNFISPGPAVSTCLDFYGPNYGYILLHITATGPLNMLINGNATTGFLDVAVFNIPAGQDPCTAIQNNGNQIGCNYANASSGCNQFGTAFPCAASLPAPNVTAGQTIMIVVENWSGASTSFTLELAPSGAQTGPYDTTINPAGPFCSTGTSTTLTAATGGGTWSGTGITNTSTGTFNPGTAGVGTHTISYSIAGACGGTSSQTITVNPTPTVTVNNATICNGQTATLTATPNITGGTYLWSTGATSQSINISPTSTTSYSVTYTLNGCTSTAVSGTVTVNPSPTVNVNSTTICNGQTATLTATPNATGGTYSWGTGATTQSINVSPASTTSYSVIYTLNGCASQAATGTVTVNPVPTVTVNSQTICNGQTATLTATPNITGGTYSWSNGATSQSINISPTATTSYTVTYTLNGCVSQSVTGTVTVNPVPTATVNSETICDGATATLTATPNITGGTYSWNTGATTQSINISPTSTTTYTVTYTLNGCVSQPATGTVTVNPAPTVTVNNETICNGATATLTATPGSTGGTYSWGTGATSQSINVSPASTTSYSVIYTLNGCASQPATGTVTVNPGPVVTVNNETICNGTTATLTATPDITGGTFSWDTGATTQSINVSPTSTTTYTVTYTLNGCVSQPVTGTVTVNPIPTITVNSETICDGATATLTATPNITGGTYSWNTGATTQSINVTPISTTSYTVTYTLNGCVSQPVTGTVTVNPVPTATVNSETICNGATATLSATPNIAGGTYSWDTGATTQSINVTPSATTPYSVTYSLNGCVSQPATGTVTVNPGPVVTVNSDTVCDGTTTTLTATPDITGGTYSWNTGATTQSINVSPTATTSYTVTYTLNGCVSQPVSGTVTVNPVPIVTVNNETICNGATATLTAITSVTGGIYSWNTGQTSQSINVSPTSTTSYTVNYTLNNCAAQPTTGTVTVNPIPAITINSDTVCDGTITTLTATPDIIGGTYSWDTGATTPSINVSPTSTTSYTATYTLNGCVSQPVTGVVTVNPVPTVTVNNETICNGVSATLTATPNITGGDYSWSTGAVTQSINVTPSSTTSYSVTYTLNGCVSESGTGMVTVNPVPTVTVNNGVICNGETTTLTANSNIAGGTYLWNTGATSQSINVTPNSTTSYNVTYTLNGCSSQPSTGTITVNQLPSVYVNPVSTAICLGDNQELIASGAMSYSWSPSNSLSSASGSNVFASPVANTTYTVIGTDANNCSNTAQATVNVNPLPVLTFVVGKNPLCQGESTTITASGAASYLWNAAPGLSNTTNSTVNISPTSTAFYTVTGTTTEGCKSTDSVEVIMNPPLSVNATGNATICIGNSTTINASAIGGSGTSYIYSWSPAAGLSDVSIANPIASPTQTTTYTVIVDDNCTTPTAFGQVVINVNPLPVVEFSTSKTEGCSPVEVNFENLTNQSLNCTWNFGNGNFSQACDTVYTFESVGTHPVKLSVTDANGCTDTSLEQNIIVRPYPVADFNFGPQPTTIADPVISFNSDSSSIDVINWEWIFSEFGNSIEQHPYFTFSDTGTFPIQLIVANQYCTDTIIKDVSILEDLLIFIPNAFTPDGDGLNDSFGPKGVGINPEQYYMAIFNRWGEMIFETTNLYETWNGGYKNSSKIVQQGTYNYIIRVATKAGEKHPPYIGNISIITRK